MSSQRDDFSDLEGVTPQEIEFLRSTHEVTKPLAESRGRRRLLERIDESAEGNAAASAAARRRGQEEVAESVAEVLGEEARQRRYRNSRLLRRDGPGSAVEQLARIHMVLDAMQLEAHGTIRYGGDYREMAAADIAQSGTTTVRAITLLVRDGLLLDAEARWRGLHELACATTLLADDIDPAAISARYLAHGRRLPLDDPAYAEAWALEPTFSDDHEWLRASQPNLSKNGKRQRFTQRWLFDHANLASASFDDWIRPSHSQVHMNSAAVARGRLISGSGDPPGYVADDDRQICWQTACSLYELGTSVALLLSDALAPERLLAWSDEIQRRSSELRPGPRFR